MSRVGKQLITIPGGVDLKVDGNVVIVRGPKGELRQELHPAVAVEIKDNTVTVKIKNKSDKKERSLWGLFASLIENMIEGVTVGFSKKLEIGGVGFKAATAGNNLVLNVGFSHPVNFNVPGGIEVKVEGNIITVYGTDKQLVGEIAANIRKVKKPEPYKGKGIKYVGEQIKRKAGKAAAGSKGTK